MQIIRTEVAEATAFSGEPILRVLFCDEGGDCVTATWPLCREPVSRL